MPDLIPVDHDPFTEAPRDLVPVAHDPFVLERMGYAGGGDIDADDPSSWTPQEQNLYQHHVNNLNGDGKVVHPDGSISTVYQAVVEGPGGKSYNIPTVWGGEILPVDQAVKQAARAGWNTWPSYSTPEQADARYEQMHSVMERDVQKYMRPSFDYQEGGGVEDDAPVLGRIAPQMNVPAQQQWGAQKGVDLLGGLTGVSDAARAARGEMTEEEQRNFALTAMAGMIPGARAMKPAVKAAEEVAPQGIRAYHGSPYDFEKFDLSKIGTGEGAQAYGHGLYFAENPAVAENYKSALTSPRLYVGDKAFMPAELSEQIWKDSTGSVPDHVRASPPFLKGIMDAVHETAMTGKPPTAPADLSSWMGYGPPAQKEGYAFAAKQLAEAKPVAGKTYEVSISADPDHFLHWDKPLSEQSEYVRNAIAKIDASLAIHPPKTSAIKDPEIRSIVREALRQNEGQANDLGLIIDNDSKLYHAALAHAKKQGVDLEGRDMRASDHVYSQASDFIDHLARSQSTTGEMVHRVLGSKGNDVMQQAPVAAALKEAGIPGIRYLDQGSRGAGEGTHNYVVFDPNLINIIKKYGLAGLTTMGAAHFATTPVDYDPFKQ